MPDIVVEGVEFVGSGVLAVRGKATQTLGQHTCATITDPNIWVMFNNETENYIYSISINELITVFTKQVLNAYFAFTVMLVKNSTDCYLSFSN